MSKASEYHECAAECLRLACRSEVSGDKALLICMADRWIKLAEMAERSDPFCGYSAAHRGSYRDLERAN